MDVLGPIEIFAPELVDLVQIPQDTGTDSLLASVGQFTKCTVGHQNTGT